MASGSITSWKIGGEKWKQWPILFSEAPKSPWTVTVAMKLKGTCSLKKSYGKPRQCIIKQRHHFADKVSIVRIVRIVKAMVFPIVIYEYKSWIIKKAEC